jgi:general secretion pathway protein A
MYESFYGLTRTPFEMSPDPFFYYQTPRHNEAMAIVAYGVLRKKGFVVITGEVGTGKTLLVRCLLETLTQNQVAFAFVHNPMLSVPEFLAHVLNDLGLTSAGRSKGEMLSRLNNFLMARSASGGTTALIVDEAQLLSWELYEEIRLLTNLETSISKLLQIVLVGQPELDQKLDSYELRQLKQRVSLRSRLEPLSLRELQGYIHWRLELAGANSHAGTIFSGDAIFAIYGFSLGIPRLANTLCENALICGYSRQAEQITPEIVKEVAAELRLDVMTASVSSGSEGLNRKETLKRLLTQIVDELDWSAPLSTHDVSLDSYVKTK